RSTELDKKSLPSIFQHKDFKGQFYRLDEPVFNTLSVVRALAEPRKQSILMVNRETFLPEEGRISVRSAQDIAYSFRYKKIIFNAGEGNEYLVTLSGSKLPEMQRRPLNMVVMRGVQRDMIYAHCLGASVNPRITITSHRDAEGNIVWYMGGQLAEEGVDKSDAELIQSAKDELGELIPWLDLSDAQWGVLEINRAEIKKTGTARPDSFSIEQDKNVITAWPTKMALSPALADELVNMIDDDNIERDTDLSLPEWAQPEYADFPWDEEACWKPVPGVSE
ncbi:MAG: FAD-dependent oxidoreductase, partial [Proteobacteria bacterium]|nr:FAD-dependent oxidoreductase [Pseudomonadota bacterium]